MGVRIWLACGVTDLRNGFDGLAAIVQTQLSEHPFSGQLFAFRGRRGDRIKLLWWDGDGLCLFSKRLENGRFVWPQASSGTRASIAGAIIDAAGRYRLETTAADPFTATLGVAKNAGFTGFLLSNRGRLGVHSSSCHAAHCLTISRAYNAS